jgi:ankyrin repeat protein
MIEDDNGDPVMVHAAKRQRIEHARLLIAHGVSIHSRNRSGLTALLRSAPYGEEDDLRAKLELGADIELTDPSGNTALMLAAKGPNPAAVKVLLEAGARHDTINQEGQSALLLAAGWVDFGDQDEKSREIVQQLLKAGADVNFRDPSGNTALMMAIDSWFATPAMIDLLLDAKPDVSLRNRDGSDALFLAFADEKRWQHIPRLLESGADIRTTNSGKTDLLMLAAANADPGWVARLMERGLLPTATDESGRTALHRLLGSGRWRNAPSGDEGAEGSTDRVIKCIGLLRANGASFTHPDQDGTTPLHLAALSGDARVFKEILEATEKIDRVDSDGWTALHCAASVGGVEILQILLDKGSDPGSRDSKGMTAFMLASGIDDHESMMLLLKAGSDINAVDLTGKSALARAIHDEKVETTRFLIAQGADPAGVADPDALLANAVRRFHREATVPEPDAFLIDLLSGLVTDINRPDAEGVTPLMWVAASNQPAAIRAVLARQPVLDARAPDGRTAMMWAACARARAGIEALRAAGADETLRDATGRNAADWLAWADGEGNDPESAMAADAPTAVDEILASRKRALAAYLAQSKWHPADRIAGVPPLHLAAMLGDEQAIRSLIQQGAPVDPPHEDRATPLMEAAANGRTEAVTFLLDRGANPKLRDSSGKRAIDQALELRQTEVVRMLIARKDALAADETAFLSKLVDHGDAALLRAALEAGAAIPAAREHKPGDFSAVLVAAARRPDPGMLKLLVEFPAATGAGEPSFLAAALHHAAESGRLANVGFLIDECGVDANAAYAGSFGGVEVVGFAGFDPDDSTPRPKLPYTALSRALEAGHEEVVRHLVDRGAAITGRTRGGEPPLSFVVRHGRHDLLRWFLEKKAPLETLDLAGRTALHHAADLNDEKAARLLLDHGADAAATTPKGLTALDIARKNKSGAVVKLLEQGR